MRSISVFGITGSIGCTTAAILKQQRSDFTVDTVTGGGNVALLAQMAIDLSAKHAVIADENLLSDLRDALSSTNITTGAGRDALLDAATRPVDISLQGIVGFAGDE